MDAPSFAVLSDAIFESRYACSVAATGGSWGCGEEIFEPRISGMRVRLRGPAPGQVGGFLLPRSLDKRSE